MSSQATTYHNASKCPSGNLKTLAPKTKKKLTTTHTIRFHLNFSSLPVTFQLQQFKEDNLHVGFGSGTLALEQAIEKTMANIKWMAENKEQVLRWLAEETA